MSDYKGVAVYCEIKGDKILPIAAEGLGIGRKLADNLGQELSRDYAWQRHRRSGAAGYRPRRG